MFTDTFKLPSEPMKHINTLITDNYDSIIDAQMASIRGYMELAESQTKSVASIRDIQGVKDFIAEQPERFNQLVKRMSEDFQVFADVAAEFRNEASQLFQNSVASDVEDAKTSKTDALPKSNQKKEAATNS